MPQPQQLSEFESGIRHLPPIVGQCLTVQTSNELLSYRLLKFTMPAQIKLVLKEEPERIIAGYANVAVIDVEKELIPAEAWKEAFTKFMANPKYRLVHVFHTDIPVGEVIPEYKDSKGRLWKSHPDTKGLFVVVRIRKDLVAADRVWTAIEAEELRAFSISGLALERPRTVCESGRCYRVIPRLELHSITICERGANPPAVFTVVKSTPIPLGSLLRMKSKPPTRGREMSKEMENLDLQADLSELDASKPAESTPAAPAQPTQGPPKEIVKQSPAPTDASPVLLEIKAGIDKILGEIEKMKTEAGKAKKPEEYEEPEEKAEKKPEKYPYPEGEEKAEKKEKDKEEDEEEEDEEEKARKKLGALTPARKGEVLAISEADLTKMIEEKATEIIQKMLGKTEKRGQVPDIGGPTPSKLTVADLAKMPLSKLGSMSRTEFYDLVRGRR